MIKLISFIFVLTRKLNHFDLMVYKAICCCFWLEKCQVQCYHIYHGISSGEKLMISQLLFFWAASSWTTQVWWSFCFVALRAGCVDVGLRRAAVIWFPWVTVWRPEAGCSGSASCYCDFSAGFSLVQSCNGLLPLAWFLNPWWHLSFLTFRQRLSFKYYEAIWSFAN